MRTTLPVFIMLCAAIAGVLTFAVDGAPLLRAQEAAPQADELRQKIDERNKLIQDLEKDIQKYQQELDVVGKEKKTLQSAISTLDISRKKISTDINVTENKVSATTLEIRQLEQQIKMKELLIEQNTDAIASAIINMDEAESRSILEILLSQENFSEVWSNLDLLKQFQDSVKSEIAVLAEAKKQYIAAQNDRSKKKEQLVDLAGELSDKKSILDQTRKQKDALLADTKNQESNYQKMLAQKKAARDQFEKELKNYEAQLKFVLDKSTIPTTGSGVFAWPFDASYMATCSSFAGALGNPYCITQYFGNTSFAKSGAYNGQGHNGIDFRAPVGTKLLAVLSGTVTATGNTDAYSGCYSYGKWVLLKHSNGLSTLYAHLSLISVAAGQTVGTGDEIGYSGATGYVTGPHLHLGTFASGGVKVQRLGDIPGRPITGCSPATIPVAAFSATLNALDYLPK